MDLNQDRPAHVILYGVHRWTLQDGAFAFKRHISRGPLQFYPDNTVRDRCIRLVEEGYARKVDVLGTTVGYRLTEEGAERLEDLGIPIHYDYDRRA